MNKHAEEGCPRCGEIFVCKANTIHQCDCMKISLTKDETKYITELAKWEYDDSCLCNNCLIELKSNFNKK